MGSAVHDRAVATASVAARDLNGRAAAGAAAHTQQCADNRRLHELLVDDVPRSALAHPTVRLRIGATISLSSDTSQAQIGGSRLRHCCICPRSARFPAGPTACTRWAPPMSPGHALAKNALVGAWPALSATIASAPTTSSTLGSWSPGCR